MHLKSVTSIEKTLLLKKCNEKTVEQAIIHSSSKQCGQTKQMQNFNCRSFATVAFLTVDSSAFICHLSCHNFIQKSVSSHNFKK